MGSLYLGYHGQNQQHASLSLGNIFEASLTRPEINKNPKICTKKIIFPDHGDEFAKNERLGIYESTEDVEIDFGFIIRYEGSTENLGEYGILGKYILENRLESIIISDEW